MTWEEIPQENIIEPIELESVRSYLSYSSDRTEEDDLLRSYIRSARSRIEDILGRAIVRRKFVKTVYRAGSHYLIPSLISVLNVVYADTSGIRRELREYRVRKGDEAHICFDTDDSVNWDEGVEITFESGFVTCPEAIKTAILKLCQLDQDRSLENPIEAVWPDIKMYRIENI